MRKENLEKITLEELQKLVVSHQQKTTQGEQKNLGRFELEETWGPHELWRELSSSTAQQNLSAIKERYANVIEFLRTGCNRYNDSPNNARKIPVPTLSNNSMTWLGSPSGLSRSYSARSPTPAETATSELLRVSH